MIAPWGSIIRRVRVTIARRLAVLSPGANHSKRLRSCKRRFKTGHRTNSTYDTAHENQMQGLETEKTANGSTSREAEAKLREVLGLDPGTEKFEKRLSKLLSQPMETKEQKEAFEKQMNMMLDDLRQLQCSD